MVEWLPKTRTGQTAIGLTAAGFLLALVFFGFAAAGETGGGRFSDNLKLAIPGLAAGAFLVAGGVVATVALVRGDRGPLVGAAAASGAVLAVFLAGELLFPH